MKFSMTGQEKWPLNTGDCLIEVTTYVDLTVVIQCSSKYDLQPDKY
jgi:hypothetical protein